MQPRYSVRRVQTHFGGHAIPHPHSFQAASSGAKDGWQSATCVGAWRQPELRTVYNSDTFGGASQILNKGTAQRQRNCASQASKRKAGVRETQWRWWFRGGEARSSR